MNTRFLLMPLLALSLAACADEKEDTGGGGGEVSCSAEGFDGASLYANNCAGCHGADGSGASGPSLADSMSILSDDEVIAFINDGAGTGMPAFEASLTCEEQLAIVEYLRDQHGEPGGASSD